MPIMLSLLRGEVHEPSYAALLSNLLAIYAVLEPALDRHSQHPSLSWIAASALRRAATLRADLAALPGGVLRAEGAVVPATLAYVERLKAIDGSNPRLLVAHAYVRYLGDLSGGQLLKRAVSDNARLGVPAPVSFYHFGDAITTAALVLAFREGLASIKPAPLDEDAILAEAKHAFELHIAIFDQLSPPSTFELLAAV